MAAVGIRELGRNPSKVVDEVESTRRPALITRHGKPVAAVVPIDDDALEDWILSTAPEFADDRAAADREHAAGETVDLDDVLEDLEQG